MKIGIAGLAGSGKSTLAKLIAKEYNLEYYSLGNFFRKKAKELGMKVEELSKYAKKHLEIDKQLDDNMREFCKTHNNFVIDARLGCFICNPYLDLKIYLTAPLEVRAKRIAQRDNIDFEEAIKILKERDEVDKERYKILYNIDYDKLDVYNLILPSDKYKPNELLEIVKQFLSSPSKSNSH